MTGVGLLYMYIKKLSTVKINFWDKTFPHLEDKSQPLKKGQCGELTILCMCVVIILIFVWCLIHIICNLIIMTNAVMGRNGDTANG